MVVEGHVAGALAPSDRGRGGLGGRVSRPSALIVHFQTWGVPGAHGPVLQYYRPSVAYYLP